MSKKKEKKYFGCWYYREDNNEPVVILSLHRKKSDMFKFPYEDRFGFRDNDGNYILNNENIISSMYGFYSFGKLPHNGLLNISSIKKYCKEQSKLIGFSFHYGGIITGEIPKHWIGNDVKVLTRDFSGLELRKDLSTFSEIRES